MPPKHSGLKIPAAHGRSSVPSGHTSSETARAGPSTNAVKSAGSAPSVSGSLSAILEKDPPSEVLAYIVVDKAEDIQSKGPSAKTLESFHSNRLSLRRQTDSVLSQRTHCRREIDNWKRTREHLDNSIQNLIATVEKFFRPLDSHSVAAPASTGSGTASGSSNTPEAVPAKARTDYISHYQQYLEDMKTLRSQERGLADSMDKLSDLEYHLQLLYDTFAEYLRSPDINKDIRSEVLSEDVVVAWPESKAKATIQVPPPLVSEYFDKEGDVKVLRDRLKDLQYSYYEGQDARELIKDQGGPLEVSDEEFELTHRSRRERIEAELDEALQKASELASQCKEAGSDPNSYRFLKPPEVSMSRQPSWQSEEGGNISPTPIAPQDAASTGKKVASREIDSWRHDVSIDPPPTHPRHYRS